MDGQDSTSLWLYLRNFLEITSLFTGLYRPHTHCRDSSTSNEAQRTQPSPFDHRSQGNTSYIDGQDSTSLWRNFFEITTLSTGLHLPHTHSRDSSTSNEAQRTQPSPFDHRSQGHTSYMDGQDSMSKWLY